MNEQQKGALGSIFVKEFNLWTPGAPLPDHVGVLNKKPYWKWGSLGSYQYGVFNTLMKEVDRVAKERNIHLSWSSIPQLPPYPKHDVIVDNDTPMFGEKSLVDHGNEVVHRILIYAQPLFKKEDKVSDYKIPCGKIVMDSERAGAADSSSTRVLTPGKQCVAGDLCSACKEVGRLRNVIDDIAESKIFQHLSMTSEVAGVIKGLRELLQGMPDQDAARARLAAVARDLSTVEFPTQDPKYVIISGKICNAKTKEPIPDDEPIMIFRAKDQLALGTLEHYRSEHPYNDDHDKAIGDQIRRFNNFACDHPNRMKKPDT